MQDLHFSTLSNTSHNIRVKTWVERGVHKYEINVDGTVRDSGSLGRVVKPVVEEAPGE